MMCSRLRGVRVAGGLILLLAAIPARPGRANSLMAGRAPEVLIVDDDTRIGRIDFVATAARGHAMPSAVHLLLDGGVRDDHDGGTVALEALRGETVAFQIVVAAGDEPIARTSISMAELTPADGTAPGPHLVRPEIFREIYAHVDRRSRNERRPRESLGWEPAARPPDDEMLGDVPDALVPVDVDVGPVAPGPAAPTNHMSAFWVDLFVPDTLPPGDYTARATVESERRVLARFAVTLTVLTPVLPYRATGAFVYYEPERLDRRIGDGPAVERQLWQLLHAHHLDALAPLTRSSDVRRLATAYDGSLFRAEAGYEGPGVGVPPSVVALGAYGTLGAPSAEALARVDAMAAALPTSIDDVFIYAIDEQCGSPRAADWKRALAGRPASARVRVGQTCDEPPARQAADIALLTGQAFRRATTAAARAAGRRAWIYNGQLPYTGTLLLDADPRGLVADGWISAAMAIERWFYWESTFWDDDNAGGHGPIDPFTTAENFHNKAGDAALGDGLLLYPGRQLAPFAARSLGVARVLPSLRLKALRRGIEDAGLIALAAREHPEETARLVAQALPAALDEARGSRPAAWEAPAASFVDARAALRALATDPAPMPPAAVRAAFEALAARRASAIPLAPRRGRHGVLRIARLVIVAAALVAAFVLARRKQRKHATVDGPRAPS
jgi:hypothetical protein